MRGTPVVLYELTPWISPASLGVGFAALILEIGQTPELIADLPDLPRREVATDRIARSDEPNRVRLVTEAPGARDQGGTRRPPRGWVPSVEISTDLVFPVTRHGGASLLKR
jgi:hypothetical protein